MNQLQTVLDALETAFDTSWAQEIPLMESAIAIVRRMMQAEPEAWAYEGEPSFDGTKWHKKIEVTTSFQVAKFKSGTIKKPIPLYAAPQAEPSCPDCKAPDLLYECIHCSASNYPAVPKVTE